MDWELVIGDRGYSSWSLRGWLLFERFGLPVKVRTARLYSDELPNLLKEYVPAKTAPTARAPEGTVVCESIAIAEELASRYPDAGHWPKDPAARARARSLAAEMHAGFSALRGFCPMNIRLAYSGVEVPHDVTKDLRRLELIWSHARAETGSMTPWLCGDYSVADAFFAPVAMRIAAYGLDVSPEAQTYVAAHLADPSFRRWRAMGLVDGPDQSYYDKPYARRDWPGPKVIAAQAVANGPSVNATCPYSGKPVTDFMVAGGKAYGFCNPFCRDKTVADPEAWPKFMSIYQG
jgi:glutathione S-transferase